MAMRSITPIKIRELVFSLNGLKFMALNFEC